MSIVFNFPFWMWNFSLESSSSLPVTLLMTARSPNVLNAALGFAGRNFFQG